MTGVEVQIPVCVSWLSVDCYCYIFSLRLREGVLDTFPKPQGENIAVAVYRKLDTFPKPQGENIAVAVYRKPTHTDRYLDFNSSHPVSAKRAVVRALMDRAENVCSDPEILAKEIDHLSKVLHYNNYPQWMINQQGKMEKQDPLIHPETGNEIQKCFYISVPYFPGLSESFKKIFKYMPVQVCFKGVNTLKSMLMHPKDKISNDQKKNLIYHWECKADGCNSLIYRRNLQGSR